MSERYPGGIISKTAPTVTTSSAPGIWTLEQQAAYQKAGTWPFGGPFTYIEDVFSTYIYNGTGNQNQNILNGIDLAGKGGLVWLKSRNVTGLDDNWLQDTARGIRNGLISNSTAAQSVNADVITATLSNGFTESVGFSTTDSIATWTFRKQPKFFDVVTYTGNGANRTIAHNLGSVPGCIIVKRTDTTANWQVYHRSLANTEYIVLNSDSAKATGTTRWNSTTPTSTVFSVGTDATVNANGGTYVAYLFAHDAGGFGLTGTDNVISCGTFTTDGSENATVSLGYEPQWVLLKNSNDASNWYILDNMRGWNVVNNDAILSPNLVTEETSASFGYPTATGFQVNNFGISRASIYIAIRRGPMKTPTSGTSVFSPLATNNVSGTTNTTGFPVDMQINAERGGVHATYVVDRLRGVITTPTDASSQYLRTDSTGVENPETITRYWNNTGYQTSLFQNNSGTAWWNFGRAPGFFDVVCYTGTGSNTTVTHNLGVAPELMIVKRRNTTNAWAVYANNDNTDYLVLNTTAATVDDNTYWNDTSPTSSVFSIGTNNAVNASGSTYVAYLFSTCTGVSKVGSYTGTGTTKQIDCGFTGGARFVLIKRIDSTGDWYVWDSARGIVSGDDPYLLLNSTAAEVTNTDYVDTYSAGFEISSTAPAAINANGGSFIFLAIA